MKDGFGEETREVCRADVSLAFSSFPIVLSKLGEISPVCVEFSHRRTTMHQHVRCSQRAFKEFVMISYPFYTLTHPHMYFVV